jgi:hypothetical protein
MNGWKAAAALGIILLMGAAAPAPDTIALQVSSWGKLWTSWSIDRRGTVLYVHREQAGQAQGYDLIGTRIAAGPGGYDRLRRLLEPLLTDKAVLPCTERATDQPYGTVSWTRGGQIVAVRGLDYGCESAAWTRRLELIRSASDLIAAWAASGTEVSRVHSDSWR